MQTDLHPAAVSLDPFEAIARHSAGLADAAESNLNAPVKGCPGWTVGDLVFHMLSVQDFWGQIVAGGLTDPEAVTRAADPPDEKLIGLFRIGAQRLVATLRSADPEASIWTWAAQKDVAFVIRHQVQEAAVHRWDAEDAAGRTFAIEAPVAVDSIEEFLTFSGRVAGPGTPRLDRPVVLAATDAAARWAVTETDDGELSWTRDGASGATEVSGTASDLLLYLYRRIPVSALSVKGDLAPAERLVSRTDTE